MTAAEVSVVKAALHALVDGELPALIAAEEAKLPVLYQGVVTAVSSALVPQLVALLDAKIDALVL